jgi:hypothetical protein
MVKNKPTIILENDMAWTYNNLGQCKAPIKASTIKHLINIYNKPLADRQTAINDLCKLIWTHSKGFQDPSIKERKIKSFDLQPTQFGLLSSSVSAQTNWMTTSLRTAQYPLQSYQSQEEMDSSHLAIEHHYSHANGEAQE